MIIVQVHNYYQQPGGEDRVFEAESALLEARGHTVRRFCADNRQVRTLRATELVANTLWNAQAYYELRKLVSRHQADVVHFHNTFPLLSPSCYYAARLQGAAVVQTLHNYRLLCPSATLFRDGSPCVACVGRAIAWPGIVRGCYRASRPATAIAACMVSAHRAVGTWHRAVDLYIALTQFAKDLFISGGWPEEKVTVKRNFVEAGFGPGRGEAGYALFVGRISQEKGLRTLLEAWRLVPSALSLKVVGDGPLLTSLRAQFPDPRIEWMGRQAEAVVRKCMTEAAVLVVPSLCFEGLPITIIEAYAAGLPVIASNLGSMASVVEDRVTGLLFRPGDAQDLAAKVTWTFSNPDQLEGMRQQTRARFETTYSSEVNYRELMKAYQAAIALRKSAS